MESDEQPKHKRENVRFAEYLHTCERSLGVCVCVCVCGHFSSDESSRAPGYSMGLT